MRGTCVKGCSNPQMTTYSYKVYRNEIDFNFEYNQIVWTEVNMTDIFFDSMFYFILFVLFRKNFHILFLLSELHHNYNIDFNFIIQTISKYHLLES